MRFFISLVSIPYYKNMSKSVRRRPWVRYEREDSFFEVHMDRYLCSDSVTEVCVALDDVCRMILSVGEFSVSIPRFP